MEGGLFGSAVLDVAIGLIFIYLLLSIICTAANEWLAGMTRSRASGLARAIGQLLDSQPLDASAAHAVTVPGAAHAGSTSNAGSTGNAAGDFLQTFYGHPLIKGMMQGQKHPTYISGRIFSKVIMDLTTPHKPGKIEFSDLEEGVKKMPDGDVKKALLALIGDADRDIDSARRAIEGWFEDTMDRASGWYKRRTQVWTLVVASIITIASNADTLQMTRRLWSNPTLRAAIVEEARGRAQKPSPSVTVEYPNMDEPTNPVVTENEGDKITQQEIALLSQVIGWRPGAEDSTDFSGWKWPQRILGWILTVLAISLGAPFWFDLLNKFVHVRSAGKSPDEQAKKPEKKKLPPEDKTA